MSLQQTRLKILIVDDEKNIREGLSKALKLANYDTVIAPTGIAAIDALKEGTIDLVISDLKMPGLSGEQLLKRIVATYPNIPVIILTGHGTIESAVEAMRYGAYDFLTKPVHLDRLELLVKRALSRRKLVLENLLLQEKLDEKNVKHKVISTSSEMKKVIEIVEQVASTRASVLITGESGVGKEIIADSIHSFSPRRSSNFVKVHCAALSESLLESELFGHEKGAFTGAISQRKGRFELSNGGTIFLDEIGEISQNIQIKLLRVLQEREFERVGGENTLKVNVRVIAARNRNLITEMEQGRFREDLYYRLNVVHIHVPPLRERKEDIPLLAAGFLKQASSENEKDLDGFNPKVLIALQNYEWPGNVRELRNTIESAVVMTRNRTVDLVDLPTAVVEAKSEGSVQVKIGSTLAEAEKELIQATLHNNNGIKSRAAKVLGIGRKTLYEKLKDYQLE